MKKQKTAVDFMHSEYKRIFGNVFVDVQKVFEISDSLTKAKEMEKEQITDAYLEGGRKGFNFFGDDFEKYYNETYTQSSE